MDVMDAVVDLPESIVIHLIDVPENWLNTIPKINNNLRGYYFTRMAQWREAVAFNGRSKRLSAGWPIADKNTPRRKVLIHQRRHGTLDQDGLWGSCKPLIDGLKVTLKHIVKHPQRKSGPDKYYYDREAGGLIWDDSSRYLYIKVTQEKISRLEDEMTFIQVFRNIDPNEILEDELPTFPDLP